MRTIVFLLATFFAMTSFAEEDLFKGYEPQKLEEIEVSTERCMVYCGCSDACWENLKNDYPEIEAETGDVVKPEEVIPA